MVLLKRFVNTDTVLKNNNLNFNKKEGRYAFTITSFNNQLYTREK